MGYYFEPRKLSSITEEEVKHIAINIMKYQEVVSFEANDTELYVDVRNTFTGPDEEEIPIIDTIEFYLEDIDEGEMGDNNTASRILLYRKYLLSIGICNLFDDNPYLKSVDCVEKLGNS